MLVELLGPSLAPHHHSGRPLPHHHTSYPALAFLLLLATMVLSAVSWTSWADTMVSARIQTPPPAVAAVIVAPTEGTKLTTSPVAVQGTCSQGLFVQVTRNGVPAGTAACDVAGNFLVTTDLTVGSNILVARIFDSLYQYGPDSAPVAVTYSSAATTGTQPTAAPVAPKPVEPAASPATSTLTPSPSISSAKGLMILAPALITNVEPGSAAKFDLTIQNGTSPYSLKIDWGDHNQTHQTATESTLTLAHQYSTAGTYTVLISVADVTGTLSHYQMVVQVNGVTAPLATTPKPPSPRWDLSLAWPLLAVSVLLCLGFWLGARFGREGAAAVNAGGVA